MIGRPQSLPYPQDSSINLGTTGALVQPLHDPPMASELDSPSDTDLDCAGAWLPDQGSNQDPGLRAMRLWLPAVITRVTLHSRVKALTPPGNVLPER